MTQEPTELDKLRAEYARQIIEQARNGLHDEETIQFMVDSLLMEWGGKAYNQGWNHAFDRIRKTMDQWKR